MFRFAVDAGSIYRERVEGRRVVYLDTNAWSDLSERRTEEAVNASAAAISAHAAGLTVFPLAFATIAEIVKRDLNADSLRQIELMDELSSGLSLRGYKHVRDLEILCAFEFMTEGTVTLPLHEMFTALICFDTDRDIPAVGLPSRVQGSTVLQIAYPTSRWLCESLHTPEFFARDSASDERYLADMSKKLEEAPTWATDASGKLNAKTLRFEEHTAAFKRYVLGGLERLVGLAGYQRIGERLSTHVRKPGGPGAVALVINAMPSIGLSCEMNVQRALSQARIRMQDFYDHEHAARSIPYVDAFVTSDRGLLDVLRRAKVGLKYKCEILNGMNALTGYLRSLHHA